MLYRHLVITDKILGPKGVRYRGVPLYTFVSLHDSDHEGVVRIFVALSCELGGFFIQLFNYIVQVATALLVAGSTLTFWILSRTSFAFTSSYSSVVQSDRLLV